MMAAGEMPALPLTRPDMLPGVAISIAQMNTPPITPAAAIEASTACGAFFLGSCDSSASVLAVSKP